MAFLPILSPFFDFLPDSLTLRGGGEAWTLVTPEPLCLGSDLYSGLITYLRRSVYKDLSICLTTTLRPFMPMPVRNSCFCPVVVRLAPSVI